MIIYYPKQKIYAKGKTFIYRAEFPGWEIKHQGDSLQMGDDFYHLSKIYRKLKIERNSKWLEVNKEKIHPRMKKIIGNKLLRNNNRIIKKQKFRQKKTHEIIIYMIVGGIIVSILLVVLKKYSLNNI